MRARDGGEPSQLSGATFGPGKKEATATNGTGKRCTYGAQTANVFFVQVASAANASDAQAEWATEEEAFDADISSSLPGNPNATTSKTDSLTGLGDKAAAGTLSDDVDGQTTDINVIYLLKGANLLAFGDSTVNAPAASIDGAGGGEFGSDALGQRATCRAKPFPLSVTATLEKENGGVMNSSVVLVGQDSEAVQRRAKAPKSSTPKPGVQDFKQGRAGGPRNGSQEHKEELPEGWISRILVVHIDRWRYGSSLRVQEPSTVSSTSVGGALVDSWRLSFPLSCGGAVLQR